MSNQLQKRVSKGYCLATNQGEQYQRAKYGILSLTDATVLTVWYKIMTFLKNQKNQIFMIKIRFL